MDGCCSVSQTAPRQGQFRETSIPASGHSSHSSKFSSHLLYSCGPNREQHLAAGVLVLMFDSEKGNVLFLNAFEYHFFVKCFKYLIMRRCRLWYLVLKLKKKKSSVDLCGLWLICTFLLPEQHPFACCRLQIEEKGRCRFSLPGPKVNPYKQCLRSPALTRGMELVSLLPAASLGLGHGS